MHKTLAFNKIPEVLRKRDQWVLWKTIVRSGKPTKVPFRVDGNPASSSDPETWASFEHVQGKYLFASHGEFDGIGFVFSKYDSFTGIDLDGCRNPETGDWAEWAREIIAEFSTYTELSPSGTGAKLFIEGDSPFDTGKNKSLDLPAVTDQKSPGIEVYSHSRYFAVTGWKIAGVSSAVEKRQPQLEELCKQHWPVTDGPLMIYKSEPATEITERARRYVGTMPPAISGQEGHNKTFRVACVLMIGFGLSLEEAWVLINEYNSRCEPQWSEKELRHKLLSAQKQPGERNTLRNDRTELWLPSHTSAFQAPVPLPTSITLEEGAKQYLEDYCHGRHELIELGIADVDYALGGGVEAGEMVIFASRPSHGKSALALQSVANLTAQGFPTVFVSEEMSLRQLGKRSILFASDIHREHWKERGTDVANQIELHFQDRAPCFVVEGCRTADRAAESIRKHVETDGVKVAVVDYAQLLHGKGQSRYDQVTYTSTVLKGLATELNILLIVLCQLNRQIEARKKFEPKPGDLKDSGQLEQDTDVLLFLVWPFKIDGTADPHEYQVWVAKNRNREINSHLVTCRFIASRQMVQTERTNEWNRDWVGDGRTVENDYLGGKEMEF